MINTEGANFVTEVADLYEANVNINISSDRNDGEIKDDICIREEHSSANQQKCWSWQRNNLFHNHNATILLAIEIRSDHFTSNSKQEYEYFQKCPVILLRCQS